MARGRDWDWCGDVIIEVSRSTPLPVSWLLLESAGKALGLATLPTWQKCAVVALESTQQLR